MTHSLILFAHIVICILLVSLVLLQQGRGANVGATFGGGGETLFGASGADNFLTRMTTSLAVLFFGTSIILATMKKQDIVSEGPLLRALPQEAAEPAASAEQTGVTVEKSVGEAQGATDSVEAAGPVVEAEAGETPVTPSEAEAPTGGEPADSAAAEAPTAEGGQAPTGQPSSNSEPGPTPGDVVEEKAVSTESEEWTTN